MSVKQKFVFPLIASIVIIGVMYYALIPPFNLQSVDFWMFLIYCTIVVIVCFAFPVVKHAGTTFFDDIRLGGWRSLFSRKKKDENSEEGSAKDHKAILVGLGIIAFLVIGLFVGNVASSPFFNARSYSQLIDVQDGDFATDISEISVKTVPVVDRDTAIRLGSRTIGEMDDLVSQFAIDEGAHSYTQINYKNTAYRVSPLIYADIIKWITNTGKGLPGYVTVNMVTQDTQLVRLPEGQYMHISTGEHFNNYLYRYVRFRFPTKIFGVAAFEIDDDGAPYWIVPTVSMRIGLFGGEDYDGAILVNACTGETQYFALDEIPTWCDKVFDADLVYGQLDYYGRYRGGFWNSIIGQSGVLVPTGTDAPSLFSKDRSSGGYTADNAGVYNYLAIDDDVYMYTGMTSANSDESLVGFVLVNLRTKATSYYVCAGATESSAMSSAEGQVQQMNYNATSPLLLNIADRPTYFLSLKDAAGLVKMYAFIDVEQYQIVGTGSTIDQAQENYITALASSNEVDVDENALAQTEDLPTATGKVVSAQPVVVDGNTVYYFMLEDDSNVYTATIDVNERLPFLGAGDTVSLTYTEKDSVRNVSTLTLS